MEPEPHMGRWSSEQDLILAEGMHEHLTTGLPGRPSGSPQPTSVAATTEGASPPEQNQEGHWACPECTFHNDESSLDCAMCGTSIPHTERPRCNSVCEALINGDEEERQSWLTTIAEAARCEREERQRMRVSGAGRQQRGSSNWISDSATGLPIDTSSPDMLSELTPGNTPGRIINPMSPEDALNLALGESGNGSYDGRGRELDRTRTLQAAPDLDPFLGRLIDDMERLEFAESEEPMELRDPRFRLGRSELGVPEGSVPSDASDENRPVSMAAMDRLPEDMLTRESIARLPADARQCCICLEDFAAGEVVTRLPCLHMYHSACIVDWLQESGWCPICKVRIE